MALTTLKHSGLDVTRTVAQSSSQFPSGEATGTNPGAGKSVRRGTQVVLFVSSGAPEKAVPSVVGRSQASAATALSDAGFRIHTQQEVTTSASPGVVIDQSPKPGASAPPRSLVTITVAKAPSTVTVPVVTGDPLSGAVSALTADGFQVVHDATRLVSDPTKVGTVVSQSPGGGSKLAKGATVSLTVGVGEGSSTTSTTSTSSSASSSTTPTTSSSTTTTSTSTSGTLTSP